ncbi:AMIN domain-containing protein [Wolinella succinogenes]|uniref:AMIN domain-containing protein n=1 Tax=Wolinella succinogenes (strain ATCC 29543 / DSM 1740 / CCUG 13145 / JCM 31913 / LMG 7466 / NCTC 11488 / FDC 602W) TaxID=273121 RepID=Q7MRB7_WOLSU|nr:AMIN domain-containing protein [Wolinella succinogenes]NLU33413.1 AMIN domain-containing protein [Wolinella succinogenes]CAE10548.1 conserved hypothetical protein [Wolinella succinogenes]VEG80693.1 Uncharacterised protein [Wolinella succinogenes]
MKTLWILLLPLWIFARDPFEPLMTPKESGEVSLPPQPNYFKEQKITLPSSARKIKKITLTYQNMDGSISEQETLLEGDIDWHFPFLLSQEIRPLDATPAIQKPTPAPGVSKFEPFEEFVFELSGKKLLIQTPYLIRRDLALASPSKILIDFQKKTKKVLIKDFPTGLPYIKSISIGTHEEFYRVTLELDGQYRYSIKPQKEGFSIELR